MQNDDLENGDKKGQEMDEKRDIKLEERNEKGHFTKEYSGGPGRGHKKEEPDELEGLDFWAATELMIRKDVTSNDPVIRKGAVSVYLKWKVMKDAFDEKNKDKGDGIYSPEVLNLLKMRDIVPKLGGPEGVEKMLKDCPGCDKFPGRVFKFNIPPQKEAGE